MLTIIVIMMKEICMKPSWSVIGTPIFSICPMTARFGRRSPRETEIPLSRRVMTKSARATLAACESVVASAAPSGPMPKPPMKR